MLSEEEKKQYILNNPSIKQEELTSSICNLINSVKKVILLSHISSLAPRINFEKILKNQDILNSYGDKFLFINSYFKDKPTLLCSKEFIDCMMSPMPEGEELKDSIILDQITEIYKNMNRKTYHLILI